MPGRLIAKRKVCISGQTPVCDTPLSLRGDRVLPEMGSTRARRGLAVQIPLEFGKFCKSKVGGRTESTVWPMKIPVAFWNYGAAFPKSSAFYIPEICGM